MFSRLRDGLLAPTESAKYYGEKFGKFVGYFLVLMLLIFLPFSAKILSEPVLNANLKQEIKKEFYLAGIPFKIEKGRLRSLSATLTQEIATENVLFVFNPTGEENDLLLIRSYDVVFVFAEEGIYLEDNINALYKYVDYGFADLDFSDPQKMGSVKFWDQMFSLLDKVIRRNKARIVSKLFFHFLATGAGEMIFILLVLAGFAKTKFEFLKFGDLYKVGIYAVTPLAVIKALTEMFDFSLLVYLGYLLTIIYNNFTLNSVIMRKKGGVGK